MLPKNEAARPAVAAAAPGMTREAVSTTTQVVPFSPQSTSGSKPRHYDHDNPRVVAARAYRDWHRTLGNKCYAWDADLIEGRQKRRPDGTYENGIEPVAITETTTVPTAALVDSDSYLAEILNRMSSQARFLEKLAVRAGVRFYVLVFDYARTRFAVHEPRTGLTVRQTLEEHAAWLRGLEVE